MTEEGVRTKLNGNISLREFLSENHVSFFAVALLVGAPPWIIPYGPQKLSIAGCIFLFVGVSYLVHVGTWLSGVTTSFQLVGSELSYIRVGRIKSTADLAEIACIDECRSRCEAFVYLRDGTTLRIAYNSLPNGKLLGGLLRLHLVADETPEGRPNTASVVKALVYQGQVFCVLLPIMLIGAACMPVSFTPKGPSTPIVFLCRASH